MQAQLELIVNVTDTDLVFHDEIDQFVIPLGLSMNDMFGNATTYRGTCNQDTTLQLKFKTSQSANNAPPNDEMTPNDGDMTPNDGEMTPNDDDMTQNDDDMTPNGNEMNPNNELPDEMTPNNAPPLASPMTSDEIQSNGKSSAHKYIQTITGVSVIATMTLFLF